QEGFDVPISVISNAYDSDKLVPPGKHGSSARPNDQSHLRRESSHGGLRGLPAEEDTGREEGRRKVEIRAGQASQERRRRHRVRDSGRHSPRDEGDAAADGRREDRAMLGRRDRSVLEPPVRERVEGQGRCHGHGDRGGGGESPRLCACASFSTLTPRIIENMKHRAILADARFHRELIEYVTVVDEEAGENAV
ncbi:hypothetical protein THAOC_37343, partial [Thalassiosira oceanica]